MHNITVKALKLIIVLVGQLKVKSVGSNKSSDLNQIWVEKSFRPLVVAHRVLILKGAISRKAASICAVELAT